MTGNAVVRAMMRGVIDYAGLFPPAAASMDAAVRDYGAQLRGPYSWMLGRFVVPVARLEELAASFAEHAGAAPPRDPWPVSVLARASDAAALAAFNARYGARLRIEMVEAPPVAPGDVNGLASLAASYGVYAEVGLVSDPADIVKELARRGIRPKVRTGGVKQDAIPSPGSVARFIAACHAAGTPYKATAGLHHAWRAEYALTYEPAAPCAVMFGFMNALLADAAAADGATVAEIERVLASGAQAFRIAHESITLPSGRAVDVSLAARARAGGLQSFGSCSFGEPVADLHARGLL
ncbi:MAG: hypothetical protein IT356_10095 [Gemmatimonadaceae bacterium]|nr:hypothetical protein [Gemmatimonadaceae bacterium]